MQSQIRSAFSVRAVLPRLLCGGIARQYIIGVCPVDKTTKTEIMSDCESNPYYEPWH